MASFLTALGDSATRALPWHLALVLLIRPALAGAPAAIGDDHKQVLGGHSKRSMGKGLAAVPLPVPLSAGQPVVSAGLGVAQWAVANANGQGQAGNWLYAWWAAAAGGAAAGRGAATGRRTSRRRRGRGDARGAAAAARAGLVLHRLPAVEAIGAQSLAEVQTGPPRYSAANASSRSASPEADGLHPQARLWEQQRQQQYLHNTQWQQDAGSQDMQVLKQGQRLTLVPVQLGWAPWPEAEARAPFMPANAAGVVPVETQAQHAGFDFVGSEAPQLLLVQQPVQQQPQHQHLPALPSFQVPCEQQQQQQPQKFPQQAFAEVHGGSSSSSGWSIGWQEPQGAGPELSPSSSSQGTAMASTGCPRWTAKDADTALANLKGTYEERSDTIAQILPWAWHMALSKHGCRVLQAALEVADGPSRTTVAEAFQGHVWEALRSPHANHVLQQCIVLLPPGQIQFVLRELEGRVRETAMHRFGCRVLERLLEHDGSQSDGLVAEILQDIVDLATHPYGNFVVQHLLEHGSDEHRCLVVEALKPEVSRLARHKNASHVVERAWQFGGQAGRQLLKEAISGDPEELLKLSYSNYGSFVAKVLRKR